MLIKYTNIVLSWHFLKYIYVSFYSEVGFDLRTETQGWLLTLFEKEYRVGPTLNASYIHRFPKLLCYKSVKNMLNQNIVLL